MSVSGLIPMFAGPLMRSGASPRAGWFFAAIIAMAACLLVTSGCGGGPFFGAGASGDLRIRSLGTDPVVLTGRFDKAVYANGEAVEWSFLLSSVPVDELIEGAVRHGKIIHIELLWIPRAGTTPIEVTATNASVRYVIIADGEVGVYGGAGFAMPRGKPGDARLTLSLRDASLRLIHRTEGFADLLTPAQLSGTVVAELDTRAAKVLHHAASQFVTDALGRSIIVRDAEQGSDGLRSAAHDDINAWHEALISQR